MSITSIILTVLFIFVLTFVDDKRMEGWVPASRIAPYNKKNLKRLHEVDIIYSEKVLESGNTYFQKQPVEPSLLEKEQGELTKVQSKTRFS